MSLLQPLLHHFQVHRAVGEPGLDLVAGRQAAGARHRMALGIGEPGVAALQHQRGIEQLQAQPIPKGEGRLVIRSISKKQRPRR